MVKILCKTLFAVTVGTVLCLGQAVAAEFTVSVKNLTNGIYFTPLLITAHDGDTHLFETDSGGGISDLDSTIHRWLNPVAEIIIEVLPRRHGRG